MAASNRVDIDVDAEDTASPSRHDSVSISKTAAPWLSQSHPYGQPLAIRGWLFHPSSPLVLELTTALSALLGLQAQRAVMLMVLMR